MSELRKAAQEFQASLRQAGAAVLVDVVGGGTETDFYFAVNVEVPANSFAHQVARDLKKAAELVDSVGTKSLKLFDGWPGSYENVMGPAVGFAQSQYTAINDKKDGLMVYGRNRFQFKDEEMRDKGTGMLLRLGKRARLSRYHSPLESWY